MRNVRCPKIFADLLLGAVLVVGSGVVGAGELEAKVLERGWADRTTETGQEVAGVGDVNGDGFSDVAVWDAANLELRVFYGSSSGIQSVGADLIGLGASHSAKVEIAAAGDVDGDGFDDILVGDPAVGGGSSGSTGGAAYLYRGSASGVSGTAAWSHQDPNSRFGSDVAGAGDLNGDGYADIVVGDPGVASCPSANQNSSGGPAGRVAVYYGSQTGVSKTADWERRSDNAQSISCLGRDVAGAGDVNGDGYDDLLVAAPSLVNRGVGEANGRVFLYRGSAVGLARAPSWSSAHSAAAGESLYYGTGMAGVGDVDGDGFDDFLVPGAAQQYDKNGATRFHLFKGSASGPGSRPVWTHSIALAARDGQVVGPGDIDADGFADIVIWTGKTQIAMFHGSSNGIIEPSAWAINQSALSTPEGPVVAGAGDVNGDGYADLVAGSDGQGAVIFRGGENPAPTVDGKTLTVESGVARQVGLRANDAHDDPLALEIERRPDHGTLENWMPAKKSVNYTAERGYTGRDDFVFAAEDPFGNRATATIEFQVVEPNEPPEFVEPTPENAVDGVVGEEMSFRVAARDPDGDDVTLSTYGGMPEGASFEPETGLFRWTPPEPTAPTVGFQADDGTETTSRDLILDVEEPAMDVGVDAGGPDTSVGSDSGDVDTRSGDTVLQADSSQGGRDSTSSEGCSQAGGRSTGPRLAWFALSWLVLAGSGRRSRRHRS